MPDHLVSTLATSCVRAAKAYGRHDLVPHLTRLQESAAQDAAWVLVAGEFKQGKSRLVNALAGVSVCPVDVVEATALPTLVMRGGASTVVVDRDGVRHPVDDVAATVLAPRPGWERVEIAREDVLLPDRLALLDAPGTGGLDSPAAATLPALARQAALTLVVSDATSELTAREVRLVEELSRVGEVCVVVSKGDLCVGADVVVRAGEAHLARRGLDVQVHLVSSVLGGAADSGLAVLGEMVARRAAAVVRARDEQVLTALLEAVGALREPFAAEVTALADPTVGAALVARLEDAEAAAARARARAREAAQVLLDQLGELAGDVDHDLRRRLRAVSRECDEYVDELEPGTDWETVVAHVRSRTAAEVAAAVGVLTDALDLCRADLAVVLAETLPVSAPTAPLDLVTAAELTRRREESGPVRRGVGATFSALRGAQGGFTMAAVLAGVAGLAISAPVAVAAGGLLGGRAVLSERQRRRKERRTQARTAVHRYLDDVSFEVTRAVRTVVREAQEALRDDVVELTTRLKAAAEAELAAARTAAAAAEPQVRERRLADASAELARLDRLADRIAAARLEIGAGTDGSA